MDSSEQFTLAIAGLTFSFLGTVMVYCLKSRCVKISTPCITLEREPIPVGTEVNLNPVNNI